MHAALSSREREVLMLVVAGASNKAIGQQLVITENTVKIHLAHICAKLQARNRQQAATIALRTGLVEVAR